MTVQPGANVVIDIHLLLVADEAKTIHYMLTRQASEFEASTTRRKSGDDSRGNPHPVASL